MFLILDRNGRYGGVPPVAAREVDVWRLAGRPSDDHGLPVLRTPFWGVRRTIKRLGYTRVNRVPEVLNPDHLRFLAEV
jgi:hypothetical protein